MTVHSKTKLNLLAKNLPEGLLVDASWLERHGYSRSLRSQYVAAGWLEQPARGVFGRPRGTLGWEQVVISLQTLLEFPMSVGGRTALDLQGYAHYLSQSQKAIHLYSDKKLPSWVGKLKLKQDVIYHNRSRFLPEIEHSSSAHLISEPQGIDSESNLAGGLRVAHWGQWERLLVKW